MLVLCFISVWYSSVNISMCLSSAFITQNILLARLILMCLSCCLFSMYLCYFHVLVLLYLCAYFFPDLFQCTCLLFLCVWSLFLFQNSLFLWVDPSVNFSECFLFLFQCVFLLLYFCVLDIPSYSSVLALLCISVCLSFFYLPDSIVMPLLYFQFTCSARQGSGCSLPTLLVLLFLCVCPPALFLLNYEPYEEEENGWQRNVLIVRGGGREAI